MPEKLVYRTCLDNHAESIRPVNKQEGPWRRGTDWAAGWVRGGGGSHPVLRSTGGGGDAEEGRGYSASSKSANSRVRRNWF